MEEMDYKPTCISLVWPINRLLNNDFYALCATSKFWIQIVNEIMDLITFLFSLSYCDDWWVKILLAMKLINIDLINSEIVQQFC